jgi:hypothetical protein
VAAGPSSLPGQSRGTRRRRTCTRAPPGGGRRARAREREREARRAAEGPRQAGGGRVGSA